MKDEEPERIEGAMGLIEESSGNAFADLGLEAPGELLIKAGLVHRIGRVVAERRLSQSRAAKLLGIDQPTLGALMGGGLDEFSIDRFFRFLNALGQDVEVVIRPARSGTDADTRVVST